MEFSVVYFSYLIHFAISLLVGVLYCIGIWISRDGETEVDGEGNKRDVWRMILYPIYKELANERVVTIRYLDSEYDKLSSKINQWFPDLNIDLANGQIQETINKLKKVSNELESKYSIHFIEFPHSFEVYKDYIKVNEWSKPIIACYKCYASFHGSIIFLLSTLFAIRTEMIVYDIYILLPMWIIYVFSLVTLNVLLEKKIN